MKNLLYIGNALSQKDKTITTIETLSESLKKEGFNIYVVSKKHNILLRLLDMLVSIIKYRKRCDYVLIDTYSTLNFYYAFICSQLCRVLKLKYSPILHGGNLPWRLKKSPKMAKMIFNNSHVNISPSLYLITSFKVAGFKKIIHIPNTIKLKNYTFKARDMKSIKLLWVRSFSKIYNPMLAIKLVKSLKDDGLSVSLCMVGPDNDGSLEETKQFAKDLNVEVEFTGKLSKKAWHKKAEDYTIFINTTNIDNTPVSVIEAMALGLPVISTNVGGVPFLIQDNFEGLLVPPNDVNAFKKAILSYYSSPKKAHDFANNARKRAETFDWEMVKEKWHTLLS